MAEAPVITAGGATTPALHPIPFITDVQVRALANGAAVISYRDQRGRTAARSVADADRLEELGRAMLAMAFAARHSRAGVTVDVNLMRHLSVSRVTPAATIHASPPLDRLNPSEQGARP